MRRFRFELDSVLTIRCAEERERQHALAELEAARQRIESQLRAMQERITEGRTTHRQAVTGRVDLDALRAQAGVVMRVQRRANELVLELAGLHRRIHKAQQKLLNATKRRRAVEILREKRHAAWRRETERRSQYELDDLASTRSSRSA